MLGGGVYVKHNVNAAARRNVLMLAKRFDRNPKIGFSSSRWWGTPETPVAIAWAVHY